MEGVAATVEPVDRTSVAAEGFLEVGLVELLVGEEYLDGLRQMKEKGVRVSIDGKEVPEENWDSIFKVAESGGDSSVFYMADYIAAPHGKLKEIRLDRIRVRDFVDTL